MRKYKKEWHRAEERLAASGGRRVAAVCGGRCAAGGGRRVAGGEQRAVRIIGDVLRSKRPQDRKTARLQDRKTARPQNSARVQTFSKN